MWLLTLKRLEQWAVYRLKSAFIYVNKGYIKIYHSTCLSAVSKWFAAKLKIFSASSAIYCFLCYDIITRSGWVRLTKPYFVANISSIFSLFVIKLSCLLGINKSGLLRHRIILSCFSISEFHFCYTVYQNYHFFLA